MTKPSVRTLERAIQTLRQYGIGRFTRKAAYFLGRRRIAPRLSPWIEPHVVDEADLRAICRNREWFFDHYGPADSVSVSEPVTPAGFSASHRDRLRELYPDPIEIPRPYVCELRDAHLLGREAIPRIDGGYVRGDLGAIGVSNGVLLALSRGVSPTGSFSVGPTDRFDSVVPLVGEYATAYFHWFQNYLPRLEGLEHYAERTGERPALLVPADPPGWMRASLRALGYDEDRWLEWSGVHARIDRLVFPTVRIEPHDRFDRPRFPSPTTYRWLGDRIRENVQATRTREHAPRIYISRDDATERRVENESAVMELLAQRGFRRYELSNLSFAEQVTLFSDAEVVAGPHGAGFVNMIYAEQPTILELFGPKRSYADPGHMYQLAQCLGFEYGCLEGTPVGRNLRVDLDALDALLNELL